MFQASTDTLTDSSVNTRLSIQTVLYGLLAVCASFYPLFLVLKFNIWAPTAMVQEVFGSNYAMYFYTKKYIFLETGYAFLVLFDYPAAFLSSVLNVTGDSFNQFALFSYFFYLIDGLVLASMFWIIWRSNLAQGSKFLLLLVPLALLCIERVTNLNLIINYCKGEEIYYLLLALLCLQSDEKLRNFSSNYQYTIGLGFFAGIVAATKLSLIFVIVPMLFYLAVPKTFNVRLLSLRTGIFGASAAVAMFVSLMLFLHLQLTVLPLYLKQLFAYYSGELLTQITPFLYGELKKFLVPSSYYYGLQVFALLFFTTYTAAIILLIQHQKYIRLCLLLAMLVPLFFLYRMFWVRMSQGTMIDISLFMTFATVVSIDVLIKLGKTLIAALITSAILTTFLYSLITFKPLCILQSMQHNSATAKGFNSFIKDDPTLDTIYYTPGFAQPLMFPSADLIGAMRAAGAPDSDYLIHKYHPRIKFNTTNTLEATAHYAIIPEYLNEIPITAAVLHEWPQIWRGHKFLETNPEFTRVMHDRASECKEFNFIETQTSKQLLYYSTYPTKVTVCRVEKE